ncbi:transglycosylase SLT domain-containing protein [Bradymonas sediminis]|uniref:Uncharacterized protein n=1 Tax=Bradymonas sediminis TaxID=1548548 RepID=A0A2Z4FPF1_9DELT|nr:transglycosylase SLT domain-containing protein [Bradymonas sediminis]AWV90524.1 hypothetical protein DN745_14785 [Bradymonas sediminis]TDP72083.1 soluble lytic murein transglycosylase [Bradymonas sediminis]
MQKRDASVHFQRSLFPRSRVRLLGILCAAFLLASVPSGAFSQESGKASAGVQGAGNDGNFRVISRFPTKADAGATDKDAPSVDDAIRDAIAGERWKVAQLLLEGASEKGEEKAGQEDPYFELLSGYLNLRAGDFETALSQFKALESKVEVLEDYRLHWAAQSALNAQKSHDAVLLAAQVPADSRLFGTTLILLADALAKSDTDADLARAIKTLEIYLKKYPNGRSAESGRLLLAQSLEKSQKWERAGEAYLEILEKHPLNSSASTATARLKSLRRQLSPGLQKKIATPTLERRFSRWRALFDSHRSEEVIAEVSPALAQLKGKSGKALEQRCEALYLVAQSHTKLRHHRDGSQWYTRILDECADTSYALRALYVGGKGFWNSGQQDKALDWFARIAKDYSKHSFADDAMYFSARILREQGKLEAARQMLQSQVDRYPKGDMAKDARWLLVRELFAQKDYKKAVDYIDGLSETGEDDLYTRGRMAYFRARALELIAEGKPEATAAAEKAYREVVDAYPLSYFAYLAINRVALIHEAKSGKSAAAQHDPRITDLCTIEGAKVCGYISAKDSPEVVIDPDLREAPHFKKGNELLRLGLVSIAEREFQALRRSHASSDNLWAMTYLLDAARAYRVSHDLPRRHIEGWGTNYPRSAEDSHWSLAFPRPFEQSVGVFANQRDLPPAIVYAIMREESGFNPQIESWANARGLLQLMEATARNSAKTDGLKDFSAAQLFDPEVNIRLGTAYIAELGEQVDKHPALMIAGYNGGYTNVSRWLRERGDLPLDLWVEDIPYGQTRNYTKRVLASFWSYAWLYGSDRVPPINFTLPAAK